MVELGECSKYVIAVFDQLKPKIRMAASTIIRSQVITTLAFILLLRNTFFGVSVKTNHLLNTKLRIITIIFETTFQISGAQFITSTAKNMIAMSNIPVSRRALTNFDISEKIFSDLLLKTNILFVIYAKATATTQDIIVDGTFGIFRILKHSQYVAILITVVHAPQKR